MPAGPTVWEKGYFVCHLRLVAMKFSMFFIVKSFTVSLRSWSVYFIEYYLICVVICSYFLLVFEELGFRICICCGSNMNCLSAITGRVGYCLPLS